MRDFILVLAFIPMLGMALRHTWAGVLLWTWFSLMNPHRLTYGFAYDLQFAAVAAIATLLSMLWNTDRLRLPRDGATVALFLFMVWLCISTWFAIYPGLSLPFLDRALKVLFMTLVAVVAIRERKHIELFLWVNVLSIGFYGFKGGLFAIASGGSSRVWGPAGSFIEDNNALGLALVMTIPLAYYLWQVNTRRWLRWGLMALMLLCAAATLSTQSRGAFLAILCMGAVLWLRSPRKLVSGVAILALGSVMVTAMPSNWESRMRTIQTYEADTSALQRLNAWETAINIANDRPTGAGFMIATRDIFDKYSPTPEWVFTAHSIYFQALGEHGYVGLLLFLAMGIFCFSTAAQIRKQAAQRPETMWARDLAGMVQVSMVGYAVGGAFLSLTYFDLPYNLLVVLVACKYWLREGRWKTEPEGAFGATSAQAVRDARKRPAQPTLNAPSPPGSSAGAFR